MDEPQESSLAVEPELDDIDWAIIDRLRKDARESAASMAKAPDIQLTAGAVRRRIARLQKSGVILGYHVALDHEKLPTSVEAFIELSFAGNADLEATLEVAMGLHEVREAMMLAGETDALLRVRAKDIERLREVVLALRRSGQVTGSVTRIVLERWWHGSHGFRKPITPG